jgi:hypothetical protein
LDTQGGESVSQSGEERPPTRISIVIALCLFAIAIATPIVGFNTVKDSHDGFVIFGGMMVALAIGGIAAVIGIILTIIGLARGAQGALARIAGALAVGVPVLALMLLALAS